MAVVTYIKTLIVALSPRWVTENLILDLLLLLLLLLHKPSSERTHRIKRPRRLGKIQQLLLLPFYF